MLWMTGSEILPSSRSSQKPFCRAYYFPGVRPSSGWSGHLGNEGKSTYIAGSEVLIIIANLEISSQTLDERTELRPGFPETT